MKLQFTRPELLDHVPGPLGPERMPRLEDPSPLQAQIDLALPPNRSLRDVVIRVDLDGLRKAGYNVPEFSQVRRRFNMPGGGTEIEFGFAIPSQFLQVLH